MSKIAASSSSLRRAADGITREPELPDAATEAELSVSEPVEAPVPADAPGAAVAPAAAAAAAEAAGAALLLLLVLTLSVDCGTTEAALPLGAAGRGLPATTVASDGLLTAAVAAPELLPLERCDTTPPLDPTADT